VTYVEEDLLRSWAAFVDLVVAAFQEPVRLSVFVEPSFDLVVVVVVERDYPFWDALPAACFQHFLQTFEAWVNSVVVGMLPFFVAGIVRIVGSVGIPTFEVS
jgi:hypothetical protein